MKYELIKLKDFFEWYNCETRKSKSQIQKRLDKIILYGYFGRWRNLGEGLLELKFNDGRRVYYSIFQSSEFNYVILLLGGNKNGQDKDIAKARSLVKKDGSY